MPLRSYLITALTLLLLLVGCSDPPSPSTGSVVVGVTSELRAGVDIDRMHVVMRAGGKVVRDRLLTVTNGLLRFPMEFPFEDLAEGTPVDIRFEAFAPSDTKAPLLTREASTAVVAHKALLLRLRLESKCVLSPGNPGCNAPLTCVAGTCSDPHVDPGRLAPYSPAWSQDEPDPCKPSGGGEPVVIVGEGQGDYLPLDDLQTVQVEAGPQGGHHIWIALRMKNLHQSGSVTSISGFAPELNRAISPFNVIFTFDPDEGGYCKLAGLRFQLDTELDIHQLLGKLLDVEVTVTDRDKQQGVGKRRVTLSQNIL